MCAQSVKAKTPPASNPGPSTSNNHPEQANLPPTPPVPPPLPHPSHPSLSLSSVMAKAGLAAPAASSSAAPAAAQNATKKKKKDSSELESEENDDVGKSKSKKKKKKKGAAGAEDGASSSSSSSLPPPTSSRPSFFARIPSAFSSLSVRLKSRAQQVVLPPLPLPVVRLVASATVRLRPLYVRVKTAVSTVFPAAAALDDTSSQQQQTPLWLVFFERGMSFLCCVYCRPPEMTSADKALVRELRLKALDEEKKLKERVASEIRTKEREDEARGTTVVIFFGVGNELEVQRLRERIQLEDKTRQRKEARARWKEKKEAKEKEKETTEGGNVPNGQLKDDDEEKGAEQLKEEEDAQQEEEKKRDEAAGYESSDYESEKEEEKEKDVDVGKHVHEEEKASSATTAAAAEEGGPWWKRPELNPDRAAATTTTPTTKTKTSTSGSAAQTAAVLASVGLSPPPLDRSVHLSDLELSDYFIVRSLGSAHLESMLFLDNSPHFSSLYRGDVRSGAKYPLLPSSSSGYSSSAPPLPISPFTPHPGFRLYASPLHTPFSLAPMYVSSFLSVALSVVSFRLEATTAATTIQCRHRCNVSYEKTVAAKDRMSTFLSVRADARNLQHALWDKGFASYQSICFKSANKFVKEGIRMAMRPWVTVVVQRYFRGYRVRIHFPQFRGRILRRRRQKMLHERYMHAITMLQQLKGEGWKNVGGRRDPKEIKRMIWARHTLRGIGANTVRKNDEHDDDEHDDDFGEYDAALNSAVNKAIDGTTMTTNSRTAAGVATTGGVGRGTGAFVVVTDPDLVGTLPAAYLTGPNFESVKGGWKPSYTAAVSHSPFDHVWKPPKGERFGVRNLKVRLPVTGGATVHPSDDDCSSSSSAKPERNDSPPTSSSSGSSASASASASETAASASRPVLGVGAVLSAADRRNVTIAYTDKNAWLGIPVMIVPDKKTVVAGRGPKGIGPQERWDTKEDWKKHKSHAKYLAEKERKGGEGPKSVMEKKAELFKTRYNWIPASLVKSGIIEELYKKTMEQQRVELLAPQTLHLNPAATAAAAATAATTTTGGDKKFRENETLSELLFQSSTVQKAPARSPNKSR